MLRIRGSAGQWQLLDDVAQIFKGGADDVPTLRRQWGGAVDCVGVVGEIDPSPEPISICLHMVGASHS